MNPASQSSRRLLSIVIRLSSGAETSSTHIRLPHHSTRLSSSNSRHLTTCISRNSQASPAGDATPNEAEVVGEGYLRTKVRRQHTPSLPSPKDLSKQLRSRSKRAPSDEARQRPEAAYADHERTASKSKSLDDVPYEKASFQRSREDWQIQKDALKQKFGGQGWSPRKKISPDTMEGIRALHEQFPEKYTTPVLAEQFQVSPEAIRRMLKSKWRPSPEKMEERRARWAKRHDRIWDVQAEMGLRPPRTKDRKPESPETLDEIIPLVQHNRP
jgi:Neugrin